MGPSPLNAFSPGPRRPHPSRAPGRRAVLLSKGAETSSFAAAVILTWNVSSSFVRMAASGSAWGDAEAAGLQ